MMKVENLLAFACGIIAGSTMIMMLAPKTRREMCSNFRRKMDDAKECIEETINKCHSHSCDSMNADPDKNDALSSNQ